MQGVVFLKTAKAETLAEHPQLMPFSLLSLLKLPNEN
jgi:hypothetical protein